MAYSFLGNELDGMRKDEVMAYFVLPCLYKRLKEIKKKKNSHVSKFPVQNWNWEPHEYEAAMLTTPPPKTDTLGIRKAHGLSSSRLRL
jgi:hypothetical protein